MLPFILLGIGIDGVFVLVVSLDEVDASHPELGSNIPERVRKMMQHGAPSITVTSLTNVFAFLFGSATRLPAVQWFCWQAAITIFINYVLQMVAFVAVLVLGERRRVANKYDYICCFGPAGDSPAVATNTAVAVPVDGTKPVAAKSEKPEEGQTFAKRAM